MLLDARSAKQDAIKGLAEEMPKDALMWGGLGLVPYAGTSLATVYLARQASIAVSLGGELGWPFAERFSDELTRPFT